MTLSTMLLVALGGVIGAPLRYVVEQRVPRGAGNIAWGLLVVNVVGSFVAGIAAARLTGLTAAFVLVGFCGALTTYSGFGLELSDQLRARRQGAWLSSLALMMFGTLSAFCLAYFTLRP